MSSCSNDDKHLSQSENAGAGAKPPAGDQGCCGSSAPPVAKSGCCDSEPKVSDAAAGCCGADEGNGKARPDYLLWVSGTIVLLNYLIHLFLGGSELLPGWLAVMSGGTARPVQPRYSDGGHQAL